MIFLMLGIISCSILVLVKRGDPVSWVFSRASSLLAGTMFPVGVLPGWLQVAAFCLPLTHCLEVMRKCLLADAGLDEVAVNLWMLLGFAVILLPVTIFTSRVCMKRAKSCGSFMTH